MRSSVPGLRRRSAAEPEKTDSGHGRRPGRWHRCQVRRQPVPRQSHWRTRGQSASADRQRSGRCRDAVVVHHLPRLRRGMPDDDRARRCHRRHAPSSDPGKRRDPEQGCRSPGKPDRHRQPWRFRAGRADELGSGPEPQPAQRKEIHRRAVLGRRRRLRHA
ncbi:hypothetical protein D9M71_488630 [compost metagenome]